jgi:tetratricopeptide (TPR) repeat protein
MNNSFFAGSRVFFCVSCLSVAKGVVFAMKKSKNGGGSKAESDSPLVMALKAMGEPKSTSDAKRVVVDAEQVLKDANKCLALDRPASAYMMLLDMRIPGALAPTTLPMAGDQLWRFCEALVCVASCCARPIKLVPFALSWLDHLHEQKNWPEFFRATVLVVEKLEALLYAEGVAKLLSSAACVIGEHAALGPTFEGICIVLKIGELEGKQGQPQQAQMSYELALDRCNQMASCPVELRVRTLCTLARGCRQLRDYATQLQYLEQARALAKSPDEVTPQVFALVALDLAQLMFFIHQYELARDYLDPLLRLLVDGRLPQVFAVRTCTLSRHAGEMLVRDRSTIETTHDVRMCNHCGIIKTGLQWCACYTAWYCGVECQHAHWPVHKPVCIKCASCGITKTSMTRCSNCKVVRYCSPECSKAHWREHKPQCIAPPAPIEVTVVSCQTCNSVKTTVLTSDATSPKTDAK